MSICPDQIISAASQSASALTRAGAGSRSCTSDLIRLGVLARGIDKDLHEQNRRDIGMGIDQPGGHVIESASLSELRSSSQGEFGIGLLACHGADDGGTSAARIAALRASKRPPATVPGRSDLRSLGPPPMWC